jgi:hypothetical protein
LYDKVKELLREHGVDGLQQVADLGSEFGKVVLIDLCAQSAMLHVERTHTHTERERETGIPS